MRRTASSTVFSDYLSVSCDYGLICEIDTFRNVMNYVFDGYKKL